MGLNQGKVLADNQGFILFPAVMLVILVLVIGIAALELSETEVRISHNQRLALEALYLAEAGVQMAVHMLECDPAWRQGFRNYPLGRGLIKTVIVTHQGNAVTIESQAEVLGVGRRIRAELTKIPVPFTHVMETRFLNLHPGAQVILKGHSLHFGDFSLVGGELEGLVTVEGSARLAGGSFKGALAATEEIVVSGDAVVEGILVSAKGVYGTQNPGQAETYVNLPVMLPSQSPPLDLHWYYQQPHFPVEEPVLNPEDLFSGFYVAGEDLSLAGENPVSTYGGSIAVVVPGTLFIGCSLKPQDPQADTLVLAADRILVAPWVTELHGILLATDRIDIEGGAVPQKLTGTLVAPQISIGPGPITLTYSPFAGTHLVKEPQVLFQVSKWQEIMLMK